MKKRGKSVNGNAIEIIIKTFQENKNSRCSSTNFKWCALFTRHTYEKNAHKLFCDMLHTANGAEKNILPFVVNPTQNEQKKNNKNDTEANSFHRFCQK